jgi:hypothetical protein
MGLFGGGGSTVTTSESRISSFQVNQSSYGCPLKLIFGTAMISAVLIDYMDFTAIAHTTVTESGGKGGGGGVRQESTTYTYTVAVAAALGEGQLAGVGKIWVGQKVTDLYSRGLLFFNGTKGQAPWGYMQSRHRDHALTYSGTSYLAGVVNLGNSGSLPNMNFEVYGLCQDQVPVNYIKASTSVPAHCLSKQVQDKYGGSHTLYKVDTTFTIEDCAGIVSITCSPAMNSLVIGLHLLFGGNASLKWSVSGSGTTKTVHVWSTYGLVYELDGYQGTNVRTLNVTYKKPTSGTAATATNQKMQQYAYIKNVEISNFASNRYVQEYVFNSRTGTGSWVTLNSRYYTLSVSNGIAHYTFNFDDRDDGYDRADPTYIRIYYTALQATVDYTPTDANPRDIIWTLLTSTVYGENFPNVLIDEESLATYSNYCKTNQLLLSPVYGDQTACADIIDGLMEATNSAYVFSQGKVKLIPYWDGLPPIYAITDSNIIDQGEETLRIERTSQADTYNIIPLEHTSRADQYNSNVVYATDEGDIELHGVRQAGTYSHPEIMNQSLAQAVAQLILQKQLYNRNRYTVKLGQEFILLEPMDAVTLESQLGNLGITTVRVVEITESEEDFTLEITFEDNLSGVFSAPQYATQDTSRTTINTNAYPGFTNYLVYFEAPTALVESATGYELWLYASGESEWWGGCNVWVSLDGEGYQMIGSIKQPARQGVLPDGFPASDGHVDDTNTLSVDLSMSRGELMSVSQADANALTSLCWVEGEGNGEFLCYRDAELTAENNYNLTHMYRGLYGSEISRHPIAGAFVRCDAGAVLKYPFQTKDIGSTIYVKCTSFNVFGVVEQALSEVSPIEIRIVGYNKKTIVESGTATIRKDTPTTIRYSNTFSTAPYPQVTITDTQAGDLVQITNMTKTSFDCYFENDDETIEATTRTINYLVSGQ